MIKIELDNAIGILKFHYDNLTVKKGGKWTIIDFLNDRISKVIGKPNQIGLTQMYDFLKISILKNSNGFSILTASPKELEDFKINFENNYGALLNTVYKPQTPPKRDILYRDDLLNVFYYSDYDKWKSYELARKININVCPYCNRSYTMVLGLDYDKGTRFEYDHFFSKARFPYLALSFYNLIPSCHICNSNLKKEENFTLVENIHPYLRGFDYNYTFSIKPKSIKFIYGEPTSYDVKFEKNKISIWEDEDFEAAENNIRVFRLDSLYNMHKDYINEIIQKSIIYNEDYIKYLFNKFNGTLFSSEDDVKRMVLGNYISEDEYSKRPLSKLTADISRELEIIR